MQDLRHDKESTAAALRGQETGLILLIIRENDTADDLYILYKYIPQSFVQKRL